MYVVDPFSGPGFDHLSTLTTSIIGPRLLLFCLRTGREVPHLVHPVSTATMLGISVTFTGLEPPHLTRLAALVRQMAGMVSKDYHDGVTHIVAAKVKCCLYCFYTGFMEIHRQDFSTTKNKGDGSRFCELLRNL